MAFNPFHGFRKHKKVIFATLTIICMFTFVLAGNFRGADAFDWFLGLFGSNRRQGEVVTTLYGSKVYEGQVQQLAERRRLANEFTRNAIDFSVVPLMKALDEVKPPERDANPNPDLMTFQRLVADTKNVLRVFTTGGGRTPQEQQQAQQAMMMFRFLSGSSMQSLRPILVQKNMQNELSTLDGMIAFHAFYTWRSGSMDGSEPRGEYVFGGSVKRQDLLDFMMWLKQADTLGIQLTEADIRELLNRLTPLQRTLTGKAADDRQTLINIFQRRSNEVELSSVYQALNDEFRVQIAKGIILGKMSGYVDHLAGVLGNPFRTPLGVTPGQYVDHFREQLQSTNVVLLPVPVSEFAKTLSGEPSPREIEELFESYKSQDADPKRSSPGFYISPRVKLQWFSNAHVKKDTFQTAARLLPLGGWLAEAEDPRKVYYEGRARENLAVQAAAIVGQAANPFVQFANVVGSDVDHGRATPRPTVRPLGLMFSLEELNQTARRLILDHKLPSLLSGDPAPVYHLATSVKPELAARAAALTLVSSPTGVNPFTPVLALAGLQVKAGEAAGKEVGEAIKADVSKRALLVAGLAAQSLKPSLASHQYWLFADGKGDFFEAEFGKTPPRPVLEEYLSHELLKDRYREQLLTQAGERLEDEDLSDFFKKIGEAKGDAAKSKKIIEEGFAKMRVKNSSGESRNLSDRWGLAKDSNLAPLEAAVKGSNRDLAASAFASQDLYQPMGAGGKDETGRFYFWRTESQSGKVPTSLDDVADPVTGETVRQRVIQAWRTAEARKLARKEAERIAEAVSGKGDKEALAKLEGVLKVHPAWGKLVRFEKLSRTKTVTSLDAKESFRFEEFTFPEDEIPYPGPNFMDDLLALEQGKATVLRDLPQQQFYVAYAVNRHPEPTVADAVKEDNRTKLLPELTKQGLRKTQEAIVEELRREAAGKTGLNASGRFVLNPKLKKEDTASDVTE